MHLATWRATWRATTRRATAQRRRAAANSPRTPAATFRMAERMVLARAGPMPLALRRPLRRARRSAKAPPVTRAYASYAACALARALSRTQLIFAVCKFCK